MASAKYAFLNRDIKENYAEFKDNLSELTNRLIEKHSLEDKKRSVYHHVVRFVKNNKDTLGVLDEKTWDENVEKGKAELTYLSGAPVKTLEDAIKSSQVDLSEWEVERWIANSWGVTSWKSGSPEYSTNYQVKLWLKKKVASPEECLESIIESIEKHSKKRKISVKKGNDRIGVVSITDFHLGADIKDLFRTPDFNTEILLDYIDEVVVKINQMGYGRVHLNLLGDFFESISGLNHPDTFKGLSKELIGANAIIVASEIISGRIISKINNLIAVNMVSGNHDRFSHDNRIERTGEAGKLLYFLLQKEFKDLPIDYSSYVLAKDIDGIKYLLTHGDKYFSKKDASKFIFDYGDSSMFNVLLEGHLHSRASKKVISAQIKKYDELEVVSMDDLNYRKINVPSLFTGNYFSETGGFGGSAGFIVTENNGKDKINFFDFSI